jgi:hypothetical protein
MVGLLYEGQNKELSTTSTDLKKVLMWLQKNNKLYKECFSNIETIIGHFEPLQFYLQFPVKFFPNLHIMYLLVLLGI